MKPGQRVRMKSSPEKVGVLTDKTKRIGSRVKCGVEFPDAFEFVMSTAIEVVEQDAPESIDRYAGLKILRNAITYRKLSGRLSEVFYSMEASNTDFYAYQFKPVIGLLNSPSRGILIADEVGLGKTIEAGLIWTELRSRMDANRLLVVCPAMLRDKWRDELKNRFDINATIADAHDLLSALESQRSSRNRGFALICSKDGLRPPKNWNNTAVNSKAAKLARYLDSQSVDEPLLDLTIVDEAHYMRNAETMTSRLGHLLRPVTDYMTLLSATPVHLDSADLFSLLSIIDSSLYENIHVFRRVLSANEPINILRKSISSGNIDNEELQDQLEITMQHPLLSENRQLKYIADQNYSNEDLKNTEVVAKIFRELEYVNLFSKTISRTRKREVNENRVIREPIPEYVQMSEIEVEIYGAVWAEVYRYCETREVSANFLAALPLRQISSSVPAAVAAWRGDESVGNEAVYEDIGVESLSEPKTSGVRPHIVRLCREFPDADTLEKYDSKFKAFQKIIKDFLQKNPNEKILVFSYFKPTVAYLYRKLSSEGVACLSITGSSGGNKFDTVKEFEADPTMRVLISTEVSSEGVDLQFCRVLVNYDLPWNPMKVEQRIGRLDRIGQVAKKIVIWNLLYKDTIDEKIFRRLHLRLKIFEQSIGGLEAVLGEEIKNLTSDLLSNSLTPDQQEERIKQTEQALANNKEQQEELEDTAPNLVAHNEFIISSIRAAKRLNRYLTGKDIAIFFIDSVKEKYSDTRIVEIERTSSGVEIYEITLGEDAVNDVQQFMNVNRVIKATNLLYNTNKTRFCFSNRKLTDLPDSRIEVIDQFHPVVRFLIESARRDTASGYPRIAVQVSRQMVGDFDQGTYAFFVKRWQISGIVESEKLAYCASSLGQNDGFISSEKAEYLVTVAASDGEDWIAARSALDHKIVNDIIGDCDAALEQDYIEYVQRIERENLDRADIQIKTVNEHFDSQIRMTEDRISNIVSEAQEKMRPALKGKIAKAGERREKRLAEIRRAREISHTEFDVVYGVIHVT